MNMKTVDQEPQQTQTSDETHRRNKGCAAAVNVPDGVTARGNRREAIEWAQMFYADDYPF
jgi:hypothetical protein